MNFSAVCVGGHKKARVAVCLAAYNGSKWLTEQVESILNQRGVDLEIFISVDASTDGTEQLVDSLVARDSRIVCLPHGSRFGSAALNFFRLLKDLNFSKYDYISFSDQDDIWCSFKLSRARFRLELSGAHGYSSDVICFWEDGKQQTIIKSQPQQKWDYLFEAAGPGCTYVMRKDFVVIMQEFVRENWEEVQRVGYHDWFVYAFARINGCKWIIDDLPCLLYRQHPNNQIGVNSGWLAFCNRSKKILNGTGIEQSKILLNLFDLNRNPFAVKWSSGSNFGLCYLALCASQCRRRFRDKIIFFLSCLVLILFKRRV